MSDQLHPWIEPELEARIVALVVGEASDFEREELERICAERSEVAAFHRQMEELHGKLRGAASCPEEESSEDGKWKLSEERREGLLLKLRNEAEEAKRAAIELEERTEVRFESNGHRGRNWMRVGTAVAACMVAGLFAASMIVLTGDGQKKDAVGSVTMEFERSSVARDYYAEVSTDRYAKVETDSKALMDDPTIIPLAKQTQQVPVPSAKPSSAAAGAADELAALPELASAKKKSDSGALDLLKSTISDNETRYLGRGSQSGVTTATGISRSESLSVSGGTMIDWDAIRPELEAAFKASHGIELGETKVEVTREFDYSSLSGPNSEEELSLEGNAKEMVEIELEYPKPRFAGTPNRIDRTNLEAPGTNYSEPVDYAKRAKTSPYGEMAAGGVKSEQMAESQTDTAVTEIDLDSKPQVVEFDGFAPYSSGSERAEATQGEAGQSGGGVVAGRSVESSRFSTPESPPVIQESEPLGREIGLGYDSNYAYRGVDGGSDETLKLGLPAEVIEVDGISPDIADGGASRVYGSGGTAGRGGTRVEELALILPSQVRQQERSDTDSTHSLGLSSDDPFGGGAVVESVVPANEKQPESRVASQAGADAYAGVQIGQAFGRAENEVADLEDQIITTRGEANVREYGLEDVEARLSAGMAGKEVGRLESKSAPTPAQQKIVEPEEADESLAPSAGGGEGNTMLYSRLSRAEDTQRGLVRLREADQMVRQGNFEDAQEIVDESLRDKDGEVREAATRMKARLGDSEFYNPAQSEESVREVDKVQGLLEKAWGARQLGRFDEAEAAYDQALRIDPYNKAAQRGIEETENIRRPYYSAAFDSTRATMVRQVDSSQKTAMAPVTISRGSVSEEVSLEDWDPDFSGHLGDSLEALRLRESVLKYHMAKQESEAVEEELARLRVNATTPHLYGSPDFSSASRRMERKGADRLVEKSKESKSRINEARADVVRQKAKLKRGESKLLNQKLDLGGQQEYLSLVSEKLQVESEARNAESYLGVLKGLKGDELILAISKLGLAESDEISGYIASYLVAQDLLYEITKNDSVSREYAKSVNEEFVELQRKLIGLTEKVRSDLESELDLKRARLDELRGLVSAQLSDLIEVRSVLGEVSTVTEPFSTFSLHVGDVSFKLAKSALAEGKWPEADRIRIEEFVNAFDYADPMPGAREKVACAQEQAAHPFLQQRNLLLVSMRTAAEGRSGGTPLRLTLLLDASGSMEREDRRQSVNMAMGQLAAQLREGDLVSLITFARTPRLVAEGVPASEVHELVDRVRNLPSEGGTNLEAALRLAIEKALEHKDEAAQNRIILITDGAANLGDADPASLAVLIEEMRNKGIAFDATGIVADGLNDEILEALTRKGDGRYYLLDRPEDADERFAKQIAGALRPAAKNVKVQVEFNPERVKSYNLLGFEKHRLEKEDFRNDKVDAAEMAAAEAGVALYHYELIPDGEGDVGSVSVRFRDMSSGRMVERRWPIPFSTSVPSLDQATDSMRLASIAALTAAKLKGDVLGDFVDWEWLANSSRSLSRIFQQQERVSELITLISQARGIARK